MQKEALFLKTPCITLREETEWTETLEDSANQLTGPHPDKIQAAVENIQVSNAFMRHAPFGDGTSAQQTAEILKTA